MEHPCFAGLSMQIRDFTQSDNITQDALGHGTHHAGVVVKLASSESIKPSLIVTKVINDCSLAPWKFVQTALYWLLSQEPLVISIGVGAIEATDKFYETIRILSNKALIMAPVGNDFQNGIGNCLYPARYLEVLGVAGCTAEDKIKNLKGLKDGCHIYVPIKSIHGPLPRNHNEYCDGSSVACAYAAGLIIKLITRFRSLVDEIQSGGGNNWPKHYFIKLVMAERDLDDFPDRITELYNRIKTQLKAWLSALGAAIGGWILDHLIGWIQNLWEDDIIADGTYHLTHVGPQATFGGSAKSSVATTEITVLKTQKFI